MIRTMMSAGLLISALLSAPSAAQDYPSRPLPLVVPFLAGGGIDAVARIQAQRMGELLGQTVVVENIGAAAGMAGGGGVAPAGAAGPPAAICAVGGPRRNT